MICNFCHSAVVGRYTQWQEGTVSCQACQATLPACRGCGLPVRQRKVGWLKRVFSGQAKSAPVCERCNASAVRCSACDDPIVESYTQEVDGGRRFCAACSGSADQCDFCAVPVAKGAHRYSDGRRSCAVCRATAIAKLKQARPLIADARSFLTGRLQMPLRPESECEVKLVSARQLAKRLGKQFRSSPGYDHREKGLFTSNVSQRRQGDTVISETCDLAIYVETGLPRIECYGVLVHEFVHLWQFDAFPRHDVDRQLVEGLAEWARHRALMEMGATTSARRVERNDDPIYGGGFRLVRDLEGRYGYRDMVRMVTERARDGQRGR